ncbi:hypothetical protein Mzhil_0696 [Methanosalsum zhilinae DSM 4017]|uniref:Uncharacterized protein n=1 Tax=Methanosalsum zhilinae (strain DSM 4017 / NBRC 107636 / OCM 62 / WeN5) TaxID=679901 RepID=F7XK96_METZD|nr:hypothetical protein [Methanosalsum zhilinae]AEH60563.1 hypothetical protein Mzhil_0696 [Methanosalsum zhilinae DSM 4017]
MRIVKNNDRGSINIIVAVILLLIVGGLTAVAATGAVNIPIVTSLLGTDKPIDLGVEVDPAIYDAMLEEYQINLKDPPSEYWLTRDIIYSDPAPMDVSLSSSQLSSYLQVSNNDGPLKQIQVRLGDENNAELSAYVDLRDHGVNFKGPVYISGDIKKASDASIELNFDSVKVGLIPVPGSLQEEGEKALENVINTNLGRMPGLHIDELSIESGNLNFQGDYPKTAAVV